MKPEIIRYAVSVIMVLSFLPVDATAQLTDRRESHVIPSISKVLPPNENEFRIEEMSWVYICYSLRTGAPRGCNLLHHTLYGVEESDARGIVTLDCDIDQQTGRVMPSTCADGGHPHATTPTITRPKTRIPATGPTGDEQLIQNQQPLTSSDPFMTITNKFVASGQMAANINTIIKYEVPDNAGHFYWRAHIEPPPCYFLPQYCGFIGGRGVQPDGTRIWDGTVEVSYRDLRQLPDLPSLYKKVRNGPSGPGTDQRHTDDMSFAGDETAIEAMRLIAQEYFADTGNKQLRPNDLSLPLGGLFDVRGEWQWSPGGHKTHRFGRDIDINRQPLIFLPGGGTDETQTVSCFDDKEFVEAVNKILLPVRTEDINVGGTPTPYQTAVNCEFQNLGLKHIDVSQIIATQTP